jgi:hypothetical protein
MKYLDIDIHPPDRVDSIKNFLMALTAKALRCTFRILKWFRKHIPNYSIIASLRHAQLKKTVKFIWIQYHTVPFQALKDAVVNSDVMSFHIFNILCRIAATG